MNRVYLLLLAFSTLPACGASGGSLVFPTGVFQMTFQQTSSNCGADIQTDPVTVTIDDSDGDGFDELTAFGGQVPAASESGQHATFVLAPSAAQIGQCSYNETDTLTLTAQGQNFTGRADQSFTDGTCAACTITQSVIGTKISD